MLHRYINRINQSVWERRMIEIWAQPVSVHKIEKGIIYYRILGLIGEGTIHKGTILKEWNELQKSKKKIQIDRIG